MLYVMNYRNTGKFRAYYMSLGQAVYKDGSFDTAAECISHFENLGFKVFYNAIENN